MDTTKAKQLVQRLYDEVYTGGNINALDQLVANNVKFQDGSIPNSKPGLAFLKELEASYKKAFPNKKVTVDELLVSGDKVIVRWTCKGSHEGEFQGTMPTHRKFTISGIGIYTIANDRISEIYQSWNALSLLEQLNIIQPAHHR